LTSTAVGFSGWRRSEGEQSLRQSGSPLGARKADGDETLNLLVVARNEALDNAEVADDDLQKVVEVVSHAAGQLSDRLHLLRLPQRFLDSLPLV
jgi:hypothetical protein